MRRAALILLLLAGCASGSQDDETSGILLHLTPDEAYSAAYNYTGSVNIRFVLSAANTTKDAVKLTRVEIRTIGSGAYSIRPTTTQINIDLAPGERKAVALAVWGYARGGTLAATEPVTLRGTAYLTGPKGAFLRLFTEYITPER
ncbi:MAG: hypothetical protein ACRD3J_03460 [Thermoanaerobaculia bacterium]